MCMLSPDEGALVQQVGGGDGFRFTAGRFFSPADATQRLHDTCLQAKGLVHTSSSVMPKLRAHSISHLANNHELSRHVAALHGGLCCRVSLHMVALCAAVSRCMVACVCRSCHCHWNTIESSALGGGGTLLIQRARRQSLGWSASRFHDQLKGGRHTRWNHKDSRAGRCSRCHRIMWAPAASKAVQSVMRATVKKAIS